MQNIHTITGLFAILISAHATAENFSPASDVISPVPPTPQIITYSDRDTWIQGKVLNVSTYKPNDKSENHVLVRLQKDDGRSVLLDAGSISNFAQRTDPLVRGDRISVAGRTSGINGGPIVIAGDIKTEPSDISCNYEVTYSRDQVDGIDLTALPPDTDINKRQIVVGEVLDAAEVRLADDSEPHIVAHLIVNQNEVIPVDLGPRSNLQAVQPDTGRKLAVYGSFGDVNGRRTLIADNVAEKSEPIPEEITSVETQEEPADCVTNDCGLPPEATQPFITP